MSSPARSVVPPVAVALPVVIVAGCLIALLSFGPRSIMGLFLAPMTETRGWSREIFALSIAIQNLLWGIGQPIAGAIADRWGSGRVLAGGGLLYAAGIALDGVGARSGVALRHRRRDDGARHGRRIVHHRARRLRPARAEREAVDRVRHRHRGRLYGPVRLRAVRPGADPEFRLGTGAAGAGRRHARHPVPRHRARRPPGAEGAAIRQQTFGQALGEAFQHRSYLLLTAGFFVCGFHVAFITAHLPAFIVDRGLDPSIGAWALALIGLFNVVGALASGFIGQHYSKPIFLSLIYFLRAVAITIFVLVPATSVTVLTFAAVMGLLWLSTVPPTSGLVAIMFGPKYMGTLMGIVFFSHQVGAFLGVWLGGRLYDQTGSYDVVWWLGVALGIFAAIVHLPIKEAPAFKPAAA